MNMRFTAWVILGVTLFFGQPVFAGQEVCSNANPNKQSDVYRCVSAMPGMTQQIGVISKNIAGCGLLKASYEQASYDRSKRERKTLPTCATFAKVLTDLNGEPPIWKNCVSYDGSQNDINHCVGVVLTASANSYNTPDKISCMGVGMLLDQLVRSTFTSPQQITGYKKPGCDAISRGIAANGHKMAGQECLGYKPNNAGHIKRCLQAAFDIVPANTLKTMDCNHGRDLYQRMVVIGNGLVPKDYLIPPCSLIEPALANAAVAVSKPAVQVSTAPTQTPQPQKQTNPAAVASESRRAQAREVVVQTAPASQPQTNAPSQIESKVNDTFDKTDATINDAKAGVDKELKKVKDIFNMFGH